MKVQHVPIEYVNATWKDAEGFIAEAVDRCEPDYTLDQVKTMVATGQWILVVFVEDQAIRGAATISFFNRPSDRVAFITYLGGSAMAKKEVFDQLCLLLKVNFGATAIEGAVNEAVSRLWRRFGCREKYRISGVKI